jgi:hypothetical protein
LGSGGEAGADLGDIDVALGMMGRIAWRVCEPPACIGAMRQVTLNHLPEEVAGLVVVLDVLGVRVVHGLRMLGILRQMAVEFYRCTLFLILYIRRGAALSTQGGGTGVVDAPERLSRSGFMRSEI